MLLSDRIII
jgi:hypothetical protein